MKGIKRSSYKLWNEMESNRGVNSQQYQKGQHNLHYVQVPGFSRFQMVSLDKSGLKTLKDDNNVQLAYLLQPRLP
jgi:hypothetical protein